MTTRRQLLQGAAASMLGLTHLPNFAQTRLENLRIIVGFPPGGTTDAFARRIAEKMRGTYANNVIVDNKPGAGGQIGVTTLKSAAADGAHILYSPASMLTIYPHSYTRLSYAQSDVTPIGIGHSTDHAFVVGPAVPESVKNIKDFVEWAKANPGKASIGNPAAGSMPHLLAGRLAMLGGFQITNVPFAGSGPAIPQVMGGQLAGMSSPLGDWVQHHKGGKIRILATSGPDRAVFTPEVPTYREQGFGELLVREWFGFFAPAGVSEAAKQNLNAALRQAMNQQDIRDFVTPLAANLEASTTAEHTRRLAEDSDMARRLVSALGFKADS
ncbi:tripartite tricarboxylate transporter substrate-binding protein [Limnohabitans sp. WS1]|jgi:tripartite-type tricarboxylate transporter receptor subunit TctC|uniref:tripartite tricarboxylate transporter substrate-binding protein n=1 Tax=Limnohabitans sp. WS1 TaxID=1100726 RepID=UPI000D3AE221|nr:tripartite tricarboxylate transporter substrate-binding protein [Limnohabitans sp. WS1]PUE13536.1 twin-arginine translocation pathway signal protein [Limnohabitans sp. WS1]